MSDPGQQKEGQRYELIDRIAVGGMAEVFRAKTYGSHGFEKTIAVKRILPHLATSREFVDRFIAEAKIAVTLSHVNIVQVLDFSRFGESLYIAMEYVDGVDLGALLHGFRTTSTRLPSNVALHIAIELLKGLDFAHRRGVVHRDISPSNILVSRSGEVKVADFGIAQAAEGEGHTRGKIMGKWRYMSPEQTRGERLDARSDLFSAAVVMFELFTGTRLFPGSDIDVIVSAIRHSSAPRASAVCAELPAALDEVLARALARDPEERTASAQDMQRALVDISYRYGLPTTAMDLAHLVEQHMQRSVPEPSVSTSSGNLIDAIINSELERGRVPTRVTAPLTPAPVQAEGTATGFTFVVEGRDDQGFSNWVLGDPHGDLVRLPEHTMADGASAGSGTRRRWLWPALVASVTALGVVAYLVAREPRPASTTDAGVAPVRVAALVDAASAIDAAAPRRVAVSSVPEGARIFLDGADSGRETPAEIEVGEDGGGIELRLAGYRSCALSGTDATAHCDLQPSMTVLVIDTDPEGASITLDGESLGMSPLRSSVPATGRAGRLLLSKRGYAEVPVAIRLEPDETIEVRRKLVVQTRYGTIDLFVKPWANVYLNGRKIGEAPVRGLRLPYGSHRLRLVNPVQKRATEITVEVPSTRTYRVSLPE